MPPRPRRLRSRQQPTVRPIILSWRDEETRVMGRAAPGGVAVALFDGMGANDMSSPLSSDLCYTIYNIQTSVRPPKNKFRISTSGESSGQIGRASCRERV